MTTAHRRRLADQIPLGVECALPQIPSPVAAKPEPKRLSFWRRVVLVITALGAVAGLWMLGKEL